MNQDDYNNLVEQIQTLVSQIASAQTSAAKLGSSQGFGDAVAVASVLNVIGPAAITARNLAGAIVGQLSPPPQ